MDEAKDIRAEDRSKRSAAEATVSRYREPLLGAAFDLQARIFNISRGGFFKADRSSYHVDHTLYVFGQYFGWREIIRHEIQFLDLGDTPATKDLAERLERITSSLSSSPPSLSLDFRLFRGEQRAIGEKMMVDTAGAQSATRYECLGYANFVEALQNPNFDVWFTKLRELIDYLESTDKPDFRRLALLQNVLIDLMEVLDPDCMRFPSHLRKRMAMPAAVAALHSSLTATTQ